MNSTWIVVLAVVALCLPFECRRFYRNACRSELSWWNVFDIVVSLSLIAMALVSMRGK